jgi:hypothetical protein
VDPLTAYATLATALTNLLLELVKGASEEQRQQMWAWYIKDIAWWRKALKIDE